MQVYGSVGSQGAGVIWNGEGVIITNSHVVAGNSMIRLYDGRICRAEVVRRDPSIDLALLRIPVRSIEAVQLRDSRTLRAGELVVAVGHPRGEDGAISLGIVHAAS